MRSAKKTEQQIIFQLHNPKLSVAATYPNKNGIENGIKPTKIDKVEILFKGV